MDKPDVPRISITEYVSIVESDHMPQTTKDLAIIALDATLIEVPKIMAQMENFFKLLEKGLE